MEEGESDELLLSSLGVASADPEDIARHILSKGKHSTYENGESSKVQDSESTEVDALLTRRIWLQNKLRSLEVEIEAVASSVESGKLSEISDSYSADINASASGDIDGAVQASSDGLTLQQALGTERLRSLKKTRAQLQKEISGLAEASSNDIGQHQLLESMVKENKEPKPRTTEVKNSLKHSKKRYKIVAYDEDVDFDVVRDASSASFVETKKDEMIRKGLLTPFHKLKGFERRVQLEGSSRQKSPDIDDISSASIAKVAQAISEIAQARPTTKLLDSSELPPLDPPTRAFQRLGTPLKRPVSPRKDKPPRNRRLRRLKRRPSPEKKKQTSVHRRTSSDDNDVEKKSDSSDLEEDPEVSNADAEGLSFVTLEGGLKIPNGIYSQLFEYQKVGVQWLWELHCQRAGGIIGDEMGLGKTVQVISFLGALHFSKMYKPSIVICPVTLLKQWQREAKKWYPEFKVEVLHDSAHVVTRKTKRKNSTESSESDYHSEASTEGDDYEKTPKKPAKSWNDLIDRVTHSESGLLLTTYEQLRIWVDDLLDINWGYAVLDEGHRIRNPNAEITLVCKQLQTIHRIIMTGAPIQNKLSELWSLFDFVFPGKLGVLPVFESEFTVPITVGGYANATPLQVSTAYRCAVMLRDLIMPYLLRRMKADVDAQLPKKTEHVLFCSLTSTQRSIYRAFLASSDVEQIFDGSRNSLSGIDVMRKICNHPDLLEREHSQQNPDYGNPDRSGKMMVVAQILKVWKEQGHRVLLFAQTQQMLDIIEKFLAAKEYNYRRMDGLTPVRQRMALIDEFNDSEEVFIFILTTKVGGLGTNLTGANRVIIYDPDWNPSTDMQARERAWRIGQKRNVIVYRLITPGTIEEKVYHRQIYKHYLTNKILKNPQQRRFFKARDMRDLFSLQEDTGGFTETSSIFSQLSETVTIGVNKNNNQLSTINDPSEEPISSESGISGSNGQGENGISGDSNKEDEGTDILKNLFAAHGIHSALNHDAIMNANDEGKLRIEEEASRIAQRAAEALRESRMLRSRESFAVPTWTGKSGTAGCPSAVRRKFGSAMSTQLAGTSSSEGTSSRGHTAFPAGVSHGRALSSAELLAKIKGAHTRSIVDGLEQDMEQASIMSRNAPRNASAAGGSRPPPPSRQSSVIVQPELMIRQLCTFIQQRGDSTDSASITQHFKDRIQPKDLPIFKSLLKEIATLEKASSGNSSWVLKPEYRLDI